MKTKNIYLFSFIFFLSCQQKQQKCDIIQPDKELQIYNDFSPCWSSILRKNASMPLCGVFHPQHVRQQHAKFAYQK